jgi:hypothetical protein
MMPNRAEELAGAPDAGHRKKPTGSMPRSDSRVRLQGLTFRITQPYGRRVLYLRTHPSLRKIINRIFTANLVFSHHDYQTTMSKYAIEKTMASL